MFFGQKPIEQFSLHVVYTIMVVSSMSAEIIKNRHVTDGKPI